MQRSDLREAKVITDELDYINTTLLLSQGKSWIERNEYKEFAKVFSCSNHNDILGEFLFLISNLYSTQNEFEKSINFNLQESLDVNQEGISNLHESK